MTDFASFRYTEDVVKALKSDAEGFPNIVRTLAQDFADGKMYSFNVEFASQQDVVPTITYRYKDMTTSMVLKPGDYLVKFSYGNGVMEGAVFEQVYAQMSAEEEGAHTNSAVLPE